MLMATDAPRCRRGKTVTASVIWETVIFHVVAITLRSGVRMICGAPRLMVDNCPNDVRMDSRFEGRSRSVSHVMLMTDFY